MGNRKIPKTNGNLILTGFMGTGKSTIGQAVASRLDRQFFDTDRMIEEQEQKTIMAIFALHDQQYFRGLENRLIGSMKNMRNAVIATGGGMILNPMNRRLLKKLGVVFCLKASPEVIFRRICLKNGRPLLQKSMSVANIESFLGRRASAYSDCHHTIDTDHLSVEAVSDMIIDIYMKATNGAGHRR
jgi:shikimate kinase